MFDILVTRSQILQGRCCGLGRDAAVGGSGPPRFRSLYVRSRPQSAGTSDL